MNLAAVIARAEEFLRLADSVTLESKEGQYAQAVVQLRDERDTARAAFALQPTTLGNESFREALRSELIKQGLEDGHLLDWLESRRVALNQHYGTEYGWKFISNQNVTRLFVRDVNTIDLNDAEPRKGNIREAIREAIAALLPAPKEGE